MGVLSRVVAVPLRISRLRAEQATKQPSTKPETKWRDRILSRTSR